MAIPLFVLLIAGSATVLGGGNDKIAEKDLEQLQGEWRVREYEVHVEPGGKRPSKSEVQQWRWVIKGNSLTWIYTSHPAQKETFLLHPSRTPKWIDLAKVIKVEAFDENGKPGGQVRMEQWTLHGIYELNGNTLRVCLPMIPIGSRVRPTEFTGKEGSGCMVWVLERVPRSK